MEEYREVNEDGYKETPASVERGHWQIVALAALAIVLVALYFGYQQIKLSRLTVQESVANETINDLQKQLSSMTDKLNGMIAAQEPKAGKVAEARISGKGDASVDRRYGGLQAQLAEHRRQLREIQDLVAKNRTDLEGSLNSTRDELNGSIARTHEELVALARRGERSYFEFDLAKSKQFQRIGPLTLSLRKADTKHKSFDMEMIVDDNQLTKKKVNLYEPIWIHTENDSQPAQVVVNRIEKDRVHGYVSAPKYKASEVTATSATSVRPVPSTR
jgi:hypothetical protein